MSDLGGFKMSEKGKPAASQDVDEAVSESETDAEVVDTGSVETIDDDLDTSPSVFDDSIDDGGPSASARSKSKTPAILIGVVVVALVVVAAVAVLMSGMLQGPCDGLAPGVHKLDNGTKVSCR
ncbi:hypothetical protein [Homoserinimonas aerilata]|uniref:hypothetical protein n=1 Tax=Homoserinimonas aerilata TaxID=1162970 RepID=UPI00115016CB|nr:hypothetical protein [Homoserinimonas aerilata]